jgi:hypothetical protein
MLILKSLFLKTFFFQTTLPNRPLIVLVHFLIILLDVMRFLLGNKVKKKKKKNLAFEACGILVLPSIKQYLPTLRTGLLTDY